MPDLIPAEVGIFDRHPEPIEITGFLLDPIQDLPERQNGLNSDFLRIHNIQYQLNTHPAINNPLYQGIDLTES
jgi:hypothetical protein